MKYLKSLLAICGLTALAVCLACAPSEQASDVPAADEAAADEAADDEAADDEAADDAPAAETPAADAPAASQAPVPVDPASPNARYYTPDGREAAMSAFEEDDRETWQHSEEILAALVLEPGMTVADVGAGTGYFTRQIAPQIAPGGVVLAVDIIPEFLEDLERRVGELGITNVETILSRADSPMLPDSSVDLIFISDTYHHFDQPDPMLEGLHAALRPGGRMAIVDWERQPNPLFERDGLDWDSHIRIGSQGVIEQVTQHGFRLLEQYDFLEWQYFVIFERGEE